MDSEVRDALVFIEKKLESIEEKIDTVADALDEFKEYIPATLDDDLVEIKSFLIQMT
jgi:prefoldin subunit 5